MKGIANSAGGSVLGYADLLLEFPKIAFPQLSDEAKNAVPEFVEAREEYLARIGPLRKRIDAFFLVKLASGEHYYYLSTFRNKKLSEGSWSELRFHGTGMGQRILTENIDK